MEVTVIAKQQFNSKYPVSNQVSLTFNRSADFLIIISDDFYDDNFLNNLFQLKTEYLSVIITIPNIDQFSLDEVYDFCADYNIPIINQNQIDTQLFFTNNYHKFNKFYCELQPPIDYSHWFEPAELAEKIVVDLGAGIPYYLTTFQPHSYLGIDLSTQMIKSAQLQFPNAKFKVDDILNYRGENVDVIISILDVINYLPDLIAVEQLFTNVYSALNSTGFFIFDIHSPETLANFDNYFEYDVLDDEQFIWESQVNETNLTHYFQIIDKDFNIYFEKHKQRYYMLEQILNLLTNSGFTNISYKEQYDHYIIKAFKE